MIRTRDRTQQNRTLPRGRMANQNDISHLLINIPSIRHFSAHFSTNVRNFAKTGKIKVFSVIYYTSTHTHGHPSTFSLFKLANYEYIIHYTGYVWYICTPSSWLLQLPTSSSSSSSSSILLSSYYAYIRCSLT